MNPIGTVSRRVSRRCDLNKTDDDKHANQIPQGMFVPLVDFKVVNPDNYDDIFAHDGVAMGELMVRGPTVAQRYYKEDYQHKFHDGWLLTGDIASINTRTMCCV